MVSLEEITAKKTPVAVVGLGYVGLPLAVALGRRVKVVGFDTSRNRVEMLKRGEDPSKELSRQQLAATAILYSSDPSSLADCGVIIIAVPTPIDTAFNPDLGPVRSACTTIGRHMKKGAVVVLESTVYPGVTEEIVGPCLEKASRLRRGRDFKLGYSPERINPGDTQHTLERVVKVVSGEDSETLALVAGLYTLVVEAGVHRAPSIKVAESAKVIENTQRDINIALMNELSLIFEKLGIDTRAVLDAAGTKWNFLPFSPGLVGGHCIGVDPYYLTHKAKEIGYNAEIILAGRRINDSMGKHVAERVVKSMIRAGATVKGSCVVVLGITFKENVSDIRNSRVIDIIRELQSYGVEVAVCDPLASPGEVREEYAIDLVEEADLPKADAVVLATPHRQFTDLDVERLRNLFREPKRAIFMDVKRASSVSDGADGFTVMGL